MPSAPFGRSVVRRPRPEGILPGRGGSKFALGALAALLSALPALADGKISGKVTGPDSSPLVGVGIVLNPVSKGAIRLAGKTNKKGEFYFGIVRDGTYTLSVTGTELIPWTITLKAFDEEEKKNVLDYAGPAPSTPQEFNIGALLVVTYDLVLGDAAHSPESVAKQDAARGQATGEIPSLLQSGDFDGALARIESALQATPDNSTLNYWKGYALFRKKDFAAAEPALRKAIEIDTTQPGAHMVLGGVLAGLQRKPEAIAELQIEREHSNDEAVRRNCLVTMARLQKELALHDQAIASYEAVLADDAANAEAVAQLTDLYTVTKQQAKLDALVAKGAQAGVIDPAQLFNLGAEAWNRKDFEKALDYFQKSTQADPKFAPGWKQLGYALNKQGRTPEAVTAWKKFLELEGNSPDSKEIRELIAALGG